MYKDTCCRGRVIQRKPPICNTENNRFLCLMRWCCNICALTESESTYKKNEGKSSEIDKIEFLEESETSTRVLQTDLTPRWGKKDYGHQHL